jgi:enediyne biosynthesis protein E7
VTARGAAHWLMGDVASFAAAAHIYPWTIAREAGGLGSFRVLHRRILTTCDPAIVQHVMSTRRERWRRGAVNRNLGVFIGDGLLASEGSAWRKRHDMIAPLLRRSALASFAPIMRRAVARRLDDWETRRKAGAPIAIVDETRRMAMEAMAEHLLSVEMEPEFGARFGAALSDGLLLLRERNTSLFRTPLWAPFARNRRLNAYRRELDAFIGAIVDARLAAGAPFGADLLGALIEARHAETGDALDRAALLNEAKTLFFAGYETTAGTICWALWLLARHPHAQRTLQGELDAALGGRAPEWEDLAQLPYTLQIVNETMRLYPAVYNIARDCAEDDDIGGRRISRGATLLISIYGLHRGPAWGADVEAFRPERFAREAEWPRRSFLPFGSGEHICVGNHFAYAEMLIALAMIAQRFHLSCADEAPVEAAARITLAPTRAIFLRLEPR